MAKKITRVSDIAKRAGVSPATVSLVLNNRKGISAAVVERVQQIAFEMGYHKGIPPKPQTRKIVAQVCLLQIQKYGELYKVQSASAEAFTAGVMDYAAQLQEEHAIHLEMRNANWDLPSVQAAISSALGDFEEVVQQKNTKELGNSATVEGLSKYAESETVNHQYSFKRTRMSLKSGLLVVATELSADDIAHFSQSCKLPCIFINSPYFQLPYDFVNINNTDVMYEIVRQLKEQSYKRLAYIHITPQLGNYAERYRALGQAIHYHHLGNGPQVVYFDLKDETEASLKAQLRQLREDLGEAEFPDAFVCGSDVQAYYTVKVIQQMGYRVPQDIAVVGFGNLVSSAFFTPPLSSVAIPQRELGVRALKRLLEKMNVCGMGQESSHSIVSQMVSCHYIARESSIRH